jgi:hypothetical protein
MVTFMAKLLLNNEASGQNFDHCRSGRDTRRSGRRYYIFDQVAS